MKYSFLFITLAFSSTTVLAQTDYMPYLGRDMDRPHYFKPDKSKWVTTYGFEAQGLPFERNFQGAGKSFGKKNELLVGPRVGVGRDIYLGAGFTTRTQLDGYFVGSLFEPKKSVTSSDKKAKTSYSQQKGNIWGGEISQILSYTTEFNAPSFMSDHKIKMYFEPFIQAGIGMGKSYYRFDYTMNANSIDEDYRRVEDNTFVSQKLSLGFNLIGQNGYFFTIQASQVAHQISKSKSYETMGSNGAFNRRNIDQKDETIDLSYSYFVGGGYKW